MSPKAKGFVAGVAVGCILHYAYQQSMHKPMQGGR